MKKIVTSNKGVFGKSLILPDEGEVNVSELGIVEVKKDHVADMLVKNSPSWEYLVEDEAIVEEVKPKAEKKATKVLEPEVVEEMEAEEKTEEELIHEIREEFKTKLSLNEMKEIAAGVKGIKPEEIEKFGKNKSLMANFLISKIGVDKIKEIIA